MTKIEYCTMGPNEAQQIKNMVSELMMQHQCAGANGRDVAQAVIEAVAEWTMERAGEEALPELAEHLQMYGPAWQSR